MPPKILCIDDDRNFCEILAKAFRAEGYEVQTAHDGDAALAALRQSPPDLVTLDILLPRRDGFGVLEAIRALPGAVAQTPVVLLSACSPTPHYRQRAVELSAAALLTKPVPLEKLLALAAKCCGDGAAVSVDPKARAREARPIAGSLEKVPFVALLHHLHGLRASGVLHLEAGKKKKKLQLRDGQPVAIKSNLVDECLGNLLAATGKITWDVMHESLRRVKRGEGPQGQILMAMHMLDEKDLAAALHGQAQEKLIEIFNWEAGRFRFERGGRLKGGNALSLQGSAANLILAGVRSSVPVETIDRFLDLHGKRLVTPGESPFWRFQDADFAPDEELLLRGIDGKRSIADLLPLPEPARRILYGAINLGFFELRRPRTGGNGSSEARRGTRVGTPARRKRKTQARSKPGSGRRAQAARRPTSKRRPAPTVAAREEPRPAVFALPRAEEEAIRRDLTGLAERVRGRDFFSVLGIEHRTTDDEVRRAYVELAKRTHPDRFGGASSALTQLAEEVFGIVSEAYETLRSQDRRVTYLRSLRNRERDAAELEVGQRALRAELEFQRGEGCLRRKDHVGAVACFEKAVHIYPEEGEYHAYLGWAWYLAAPEEPGRLEEAMEQVREARKLAPDREKVYLFLGKLYKAAGRGAVAERMFSRAIQLDPDCVEALRELRLMDMRRDKSKGLMRRILRR